MIKRIGISLSVFFYVLALCRGQATYDITFDGSPPQPPGTSFFIQQYFEAGMWFRPLGVIGPGNGFSHRRGGATVAFAPDNGSAYLAAASGDSLVFSFTGGTSFNLISVDLAEYSTVVPDPATVPFIGYRADGSTVTANFTTDGIIDGSGPLEDFEMFQFGPEWSGLSRVEIPADGWSLDNLYVSISEPGTWALVLVGGLLLGALKFRRRDRA